MPGAAPTVAPTAAPVGVSLTAASSEVVEAAASAAPGASSALAAVAPPEASAPSAAATTGALAGQVLSSAWTSAFEEDGLREFEVGERLWMQNPYFKDGTKLRSGPSHSDPFLDQFVLNDACVEIVELSAEGDYARVRLVAEEGEEEEEGEGWVRTRNISRIERKAGLPDLNKLAQMAAKELERDEALIHEMEEEAQRAEDKLRDNDLEILELRRQLAAMSQAQASSTQKDAPSSVPPPPNVDVVTTVPLAAMRSRLKRTATEAKFILPVVEESAATVTAEVSPHDGLAGAPAATQSHATGAADSPQEHEKWAESQADKATFDAAIAARDTATAAANLARWLKEGLEKSNVRMLEFFRDIDKEQKGHITKETFVTNLKALETPYSEQQLAQVYEQWDVDGSCTLDYKELDRAIRGAAKKSSVSLRDAGKGASGGVYGRSVRGGGGRRGCAWRGGRAGSTV